MQSTSEHTPGPWEWAPVLDDNDEPPTITIQATRPRMTIYIARMASWGDWQDPEVEANADLMTAAPDMLAALQILVDHAQETYPHFESERGQRDIAAALTAIRKAKGE